MLNLLWGNPSFLEAYWNVFPHKQPSLDKTLSYKFDGDERLKKAITDVHNQIGNACLKNKTIVIGNGATQLLLALLWVLKNNPELIRVNAKKPTAAWAQPPHYSRFSILAKQAGLKWKKGKDSIQIATIPNNPDGAFYTYESCSILDLSYMWPQYVPVIKKFNHPIMVFSLSKATGHANTRIGWAIIENPEIAKKVKEFIEYNSNGVSLDAQTRAACVLESQINTNFTVFEDGTLTLLERWNRINTIRSRLPFTVLNENGMFLWAKGSCPKEIVSMSGSDLGTTANYFRLNIGCSDEEFDRLMVILLNHARV
jgi:L-tryptophan---pyruvate aminotransferase